MEACSVLQVVQTACHVSETTRTKTSDTHSAIVDSSCSPKAGNNPNQAVGATKASQKQSRGTTTT